MNSVSVKEKDAASAKPSDQLLYIEGDEIAAVVIEPEWLTIRQPATILNPWSKVRSTVDGGVAYWNKSKRMSVILSGFVEIATARRWIHLSIAKRDQMPTYDELATAKRLFVGDDIPGYFVFAPKAEHVNLHPFALHVWCPIDSVPLPDFRLGRKGAFQGI